MYHNMVKLLILVPKITFFFTILLVIFFLLRFYFLIYKLFFSHAAVPHPCVPGGNAVHGFEKSSSALQIIFVSQVGFDIS